jgi:hypothetical protein
VQFTVGGWVDGGWLQADAIGKSEQRNKDKSKADKIFFFIKTPL